MNVKEISQTQNIFHLTDLVRENKTMYGVFIYVVNDESNEPVRCDYFNYKKGAINKALSHLIQLDLWLRKNNSPVCLHKKTFWDCWYIEVWKKDRKGLYGNSGLPVWCTRNSGHYNAVINKKRIYS